MQIAHIVRLARVRHWVKNAIVLFPVAFGLRLGDWGAWGRALLAMAAFSLVSSAIYAFNDVHDRQADRLHPRKRLRPVASGQIGVGQAIGLGIGFLLGGTLIAAAVNKLVLALVVGYVLLQVAYTFWLKQKMLVDVMCIATGFVLRAAGGALAIPVVVSPWLIICTFMLCLFMGFCKRRCEVRTLAEVGQVAGHRQTLSTYTPELLTHLITLSAGIAVVSLLLYASSPRTLHQFGTTWLVYTTPIFLYGVGRFAMLCIVGVYDDPTELILRDRAFQVTVVLWLAAVVAVIFWGAALQGWIAELVHVGQAQHAQ